MALFEAMVVSVEPCSDLTWRSNSESIGKNLKLRGEIYLRIYLNSLCMVCLDNFLNYSIPSGRDLSNDNV